MFEFTPDTAVILLKQIQAENIRSRSLPKAPMMRPARPKLQKTHDRYLLVPQADSANPEDWYYNDPFKK